MTGSSFNRDWFSETLAEGPAGERKFHGTSRAQDDSRGNAIKSYRLKRSFRFELESRA
jgi:hypothetical protein